MSTESLSELVDKTGKKHARNAGKGVDSLHEFRRGFFADARGKKFRQYLRSKPDKIILKNTPNFLKGYNTKC